MRFFLGCGQRRSTLALQKIIETFSWTAAAFELDHDCGDIIWRQLSIKESRICALNVCIDIAMLSGVEQTHLSDHRVINLLWTSDCQAQRRCETAHVAIDIPRPVPPARHTGSASDVEGKRTPVELHLPSTRQHQTAMRRNIGIGALHIDIERDRDHALIFSRTGKICWRNRSGFSDIGKWPIPSIIIALDPLIRDAVASVRSGVQELSYSPDSR